MTRPLTILATLAALSVSLPAGAEAAARHRTREPLVQRHQAVGVAVPIVAGSSSVRVDAVGQVVTDFNAGQLSDSGRATGDSR